MKYDGGCLCGKTTYSVTGDPLNPHLCSCTMCQKSSGAPTVAWVEFPLNAFQWTGVQPGLFQSSTKTTRCFCQQCGGLLGTLNDGYANVCITIVSLHNPNLIAPNEKHSYKKSAPVWWRPQVVNQRENKALCLQTIAVIVDHTPSQADNDAVKEGLISFNEQIMGEPRDKEFSVFLKDDLGKIFGGIQAHFDKESVYIEVLWVDEELRKQGYGKKLLDATEKEAIKNGCSFSIVDTLSFQAEPFYLKNGYKRMGEVKNYWYEHSRIFLRKTL